MSKQAQKEVFAMIILESNGIKVDSLPHPQSSIEMVPQFFRFQWDDQADNSDENSKTDELS